LQTKRPRLSKEIISDSDDDEPIASTKPSASARIKPSTAAAVSQAINKAFTDYTGEPVLMDTQPGAFYSVSLSFSFLILFRLRP
jgi:hypothetical protein